MKDLRNMPGRDMFGETVCLFSPYPSSQKLHKFPSLCGAFQTTFRKSIALVYARNGTDHPLWEHISVHIKDESRCPTWEELDTIRNLFWEDTAIVVQYHPKQSEYVNNSPYLLHLWARKGSFPLPNFSVLLSHFDYQLPYCFSINQKDIVKIQFGKTRGNQWEFASVEVVTSHRLPTWEEMCYAKKIAWPDPETLAVQFHLRASNLPNRLVMWKFNGDFPRPAKNLV